MRVLTTPWTDISGEVGQMDGHFYGEIFDLAEQRHFAADGRR